MLLTTAFLLFAAGTASAAYTLRDNYDHSNFFNEFTFFSDPDPTHGFVNYAAPTAANLSALAGYDSKAVYLGVDYNTKNPSGSGRGSVRVHSQKTYTRGLFVADIAHMPASICGSWPAFVSIQYPFTFPHMCTVLIDFVYLVDGRR